MKKLLFVALLCLSTAINAQTTYVLTMGIQNYNNPEFQHPSLFSSSNDAIVIDSIFKKKGAKTACLTGKYVTKENVMDKIRRMKYKVNEHPGKDNIAIFVSLHGSENGYIAAWDQHIYFGDILNTLADAKAKNIFLFLNDCHAGSAGKVFLNLPKEKRNPNLFIFTACRVDESAIDESILGSAWFSAALIKGLRGACDNNRDRIITVRELHQYIYDDVVRRCEKQNEYAKEHPDEKLLENDYAMHPQLYGPKSKMDETVISYAE